MLKTITTFRILMERTQELSNVSFWILFSKLIEFKMYTYCSPETQLH
jgi:hypothetical protein